MRINLVSLLGTLAISFAAQPAVFAAGPVETSPHYDCSVYSKAPILVAYPATPAGDQSQASGDDLPKIVKGRTFKVGEDTYAVTTVRFLYLLVKDSASLEEAKAELLDSCVKEILKQVSNDADDRSLTAPEDLSKTLVYRATPPHSDQDLKDDAKSLGKNDLMAQLIDICHEVSEKARCTERDRTSGESGN